MIGHSKSVDRFLYIVIVSGVVPSDCRWKSSQQSERSSTNTTASKAKPFQVMPLCLDEVTNSRKAKTVLAQLLHLENRPVCTTQVLHALTVQSVAQKIHLLQLLPLGLDQLSYTCCI